MSREPSVSYVSARNLDLNSAAVAHQAELEGFGEASKSDGDSASRDYLGGGDHEEEKNVSDVERKEGNKERNEDDLILDVKSALFCWNKDEEAPNPTAQIVEESDKNNSKFPPGDKSLETKDLFANDTDSDVLNKAVSSGEVEEAANFEPERGSLESDKLGQYADNKQLQSKEGQERKPEFSVGDVVWGKVRSHPWWPGQIYHPSFASEMALRHQKKDHFLISYFGDKTFAWNEEARLRPFESRFSQMEKQSSLDAFVDAVEEALEEVARCTVIGMTCGCIADELIADLKYQMVENAGIKEGTYFPTVDRCLVVSSFEPDRLLDYIHSVAQLPCGDSDKLEFVKVKAVLKAIYRSKGYPELPEFCFGGGLLPNEEEVSAPEREEAGKDDAEYKDGILLDDTSLKEKRRGRGRPPGKKKLIVEEGRKQRSLPELMKQTVDSTSLNSMEGKDGVKDASKSSSRKHMISGSDSVDCGKSKKKRLNSLGDIGSMPASSSHMRAVKIGQRISRVANEMKFSCPVFVRNDTKLHNGNSKVNGRTSSVDGRCKAPRRNAALIQEYPTPREMLSHLCLAAKDPTKTYQFQSMVVCFFVNWRDSHATDSLEDEKLLNLVESKKGREKLVESDVVPVEVKSEYFQDSYWSDVLFEKNPKKEGLSRGKRKAKSKMNHAKKTKAAEISSLYSTLKPTLNSSEHVSDGSAILSDNNQQREEILVNYSDDKTVEECNPAALILRFSDHNALPSESDLIMIFSQYGPLKEAETEVSRKRRRASVTFKRGVDAEVAFSSAGKFSAFGPALVSYRLMYSTSSSPGTTTPKKDPSPTVGGTSVLPEDSGVVPTDGKA